MTHSFLLLTGGSFETKMNKAQTNSSAGTA